MTFSRPHAGMVGIISLFTGMIAPVFRSGVSNYAFPLTDMQIFSYIIFLLLVIAFYLVSTRKWDGFRAVNLIILILIGYMTYQSITGGVQNHQGVVLTDFRWGWIFIIVGGILTITVYCMKADDAHEDDMTAVSDSIIGTIGALTLFIFSLLIIGASYHKSETKPMLNKLLKTQTITTLSGVSLSESYPHISGLIFDRKNDRITYQVASTGGAMIYPHATYYTGTDIRTQWIGKKFIVLSNKDIWIDGISQTGVLDTILKDSTLLMRKNDGTTTIMMAEKDETYHDQQIRLDSIQLSNDHGRAVWIKDTDSGAVISQNNKIISETYPSIMRLSLSENGAQNIALAEDQDHNFIILKDGIPAEMIRSGAILASWQSNGLHNIYVAEDSGNKHLIYDGVSIGKEFADIREIFLEKNGNGYAYFAREPNEKTYCLYTRYRGNLCGLSGYMNPRMSADGSTIIFAGKKGSIWSIYRNTDAIIRDTGYTPQDNSGDYAYYDLTNPREYVFIERMNDGRYQVRKNGKIIPKIWTDVGLDVSFGYDGKVIMSAQDEAGWHIVEL